MIKRYRKLPIVIEAVQWDGGNLQELIDWGVLTRWIDKEEGRPIEWENLSVPQNDWLLQVYVSAEICWCNVPVGHYIIRGIKGEFYPHDPDIFKQVYREVDDYTGGENG